MQYIHCNIKIMNYIKPYILILLFCIVLMICNINNVNAAITISSKDKIDIGETITVTVDFGTNVAAYDLLQITYNSRILSNTSTIPLVERYWFDTSEQSNGIRYKTYTFTGQKNGTLNIGVTVNGLVSANSTMDELGDSYTYKTIIVGNGIEPGDLNQDGYMNSTDAAIVLDLFKNGGVTEEYLMYGDMNGDNLLNSTDAAMILDIYKNS